MNRPLARIVTAAFVLALATAGGAAALDHFLAYQVSKVGVAFKVRLTDQFATGAKDAKLTAITHFANATRKVHSGASFGVEDGNAHLTWYALRQPQAEPRRTVRYRNQFGQHSVDIKEPRFLLVPTQKTSHAGSDFPKGLDHYKCYRVVRVNTAPPLPLVKLGDQFGSQSGVQVKKPVFFCTPVRKQRGDEKPPELFNEKDHLAIYALPAAPRRVVIKTKDQFGDHELKVSRSVMLLVPTEKQVAVAHQN